MQSNSTKHNFNLEDFDYKLMHEGPLYAALVRAGIAKSGLAGIAFRISLIIGFTWVPLLILSMWQGTAIGSSVKITFLGDYAEATRFLLVGPLLIAAQAFIAPWLIHVAKHLRMQVQEKDLPEFQTYLLNVTRAHDSILVDVIIIFLAFGRNFFMPELDFSGAVTSWHHIVAGSNEPSLAFYWYQYLAKPLITVLWLTWVWRYIIWSLFLVRASKLSLKIIPTHPDLVGGLGFIAVGQAKFSILVFALAAQLSGVFSQGIFYEDLPLMSFRHGILAELVISLIIIVCPLLVFIPQLQACKRRGLFEYGALADEYTETYHRKWINERSKVEEPILGNNDVQSLADLITSYDTVRRMKSTLLTKDLFLAVIFAALIPFAPLLLSIYPLDELIERLFKAILKF
jgi:hypothetical protein